MSEKRKLILYIAMSLDGFIAKHNDDISFLSLVEQENEDYGFSKFIKSIDTIIIGRKTYDNVIKMGFEYPHKDKEVYILTRTPKQNIGNFKFYTGDLKELVTKLKEEKGRNIYCDGGATVVNELMKHNLIDEFIISVVPIILGDGISLFVKGINELNLRLIKAMQFEKGLVQLHYIAKNG